MHSRDMHSETSTQVLLCPFTKGLDQEVNLHCFTKKQNRVRLRALSPLQNEGVRRRRDKCLNCTLWWHSNAQQPRNIFNVQVTLGLCPSPQRRDPDASNSCRAFQPRDTNSMLCITASLQLHTSENHNTTGLTSTTDVFHVPFEHPHWPHGARHLFLHSRRHAGRHLRRQIEQHSLQSEAVGVENCATSVSN